jgi:hypothetical protein
MGSVRPARKVTGPDGRGWELYVTRPLGLLPARLARRLRPGDLRVEAITFLPRREGYLWTTNGDHLDRVVEQIAAGLAAGELARPLGAV